MRYVVILLWICLLPALLFGQRVVSGKSEGKRVKIEPVYEFSKPSRLSVSMRLQDRNEDGLIEAAEPVKLYVYFQNSGEGSAFGIKVERLDTSRNTLICRENIYLSELKAGAERMLVIPLLASEDLRTGIDSLRFSVSEYFGVQPDTSVVICTIGFFSNLRDLLQSGADEYSDLSGKELVAKKVKRLVSMAGLFPEGKEFNVYCDVPASKVVADEWPTEIVFSGFEIGNVILTGKKLVQMNVENSPVKDAYALCFAEGDPEGRMSWDHTAVLVAIKGYEPYFDVERGTFHVVDDEGTNNWVANPNGRDLRLIEKMPPTEVASLIENYMMHQPSIK